MPLALSQTGDTVVIKEIKGREDVRQHLVELFLQIGSAMGLQQGFELCYRQGLGIVKALDNIAAIMLQEQEL